MTPLDTEVWTQGHLRAWAVEFADANLVQAKQVLVLLAEVDELRAEVARLRKLNVWWVSLKRLRKKKPKEVRNADV